MYTPEIKIYASKFIFKNYSMFKNISDLNLVDIIESHVKMRCKLIKIFLKK